VEELDEESRTTKVEDVIGTEIIGLYRETACYEVVGHTNERTYRQTDR